MGQGQGGGVVSEMEAGRMRISICLMAASDELNYP